MLTNNITFFLPYGSVTIPDKILPTGCKMNIIPAARLKPIEIIESFAYELSIDLPSHDASSAVIYNVSSEFKLTLMPVSDEIAIAGSANANPNSKINKFNTEVAKN